MTEQDLAPLVEELKHLREQVQQLTSKLEAKRVGKTLCTRCGAEFNHRFERESCPHFPIVHRRKYKLKHEEVEAIINAAKGNNLRDYLIFRLLGLKGFRDGTIVGSTPRRWDKKNRAWIPCEPNCKGLMIEDLRENGIWVHAKGASAGRTNEKFFDLPMDLISDIRGFIGKRQKGKIFDVSISRVEQLAKQYAKIVGVVEWRLVKPHSFRHFVTTDVIKKEGLAVARDYVGHKDGKTTMGYADETEPEELAQTTKRIGKMLTEVSV